MELPLTDLSIQNQKFVIDYLDELKKVLLKGDFILGQKVTEFEEAFADYCGVPYGIGVANGTDALTLALKSLQLPAQSEILVPTNTFFATVEGILNAGLRPVFVDTDPDTYLIDVADAAKRVTEKTRALIVVHLYGQVGPMTELCEWARVRNLALIEDCAQAHGAKFKGQRAGSFGDVATFSFYPSKNLGGFGDGGMILTRNESLANEIRALRNHGGQSKYEHYCVGLNSRLDTIQAAILQLKLPHLDGWNKERQEKAHLLCKKLRGLPIELPMWEKDESHVFHLFVVKVPARDQVFQSMKTKGIQCGIHYPTPCHLLPPFQQDASSSLPFSEKTAKEILSLPFFPEISEHQLNTIAYELERALFEAEHRLGRNHEFTARH